MSIVEPQNARSRRTREAIQSSALQLLRESGAAAVTMAAVADLAGCSRRALYLHFDSRADLLISLIAYTNESEGLKEDLRILNEATSPVDRIRAAGEFLGRYHTKIAPIVLAVAQVRDSDEDAGRMWATAMAAWRDSCHGFLTPIAANGLLHPRFDDLEDAVDMMWSLMSVEILRGLVHARGWPPQKYGHYMGELFVAMFVRSHP